MISVETPQTLYLGRVGEQNVEPITFDISPWITRFGQGITTLTVKRVCDKIPYPVDLVSEENTVTWTINRKDVECYGIGKAELTYMVDDKIKKSVLYKTYTEKSLSDMIPTPENGQTWLDAVTNQVLKAKEHATQAESYAHGGTGVRVDEETDNAKYYATKADESAKSIAGVQQIVKESAQKVAEDVKQVELTKQAVDKTATDVADTESRINQVKQDIDSIQQNVQTNKDAVDIAKKAVEVSQLDVTKKSEQVTKDAQQVATDKDIVTQAKNDIGNKIQEHNVSPISHEDIRGLINGLTTRLNALADSDDESLDQLSEVVAYIKSNKTLIENITTNKVNVADIVNNLTTNVSNKPLSASMGVELKRLIDAIKVPTKVSELQNDSGYLTKHQDISGKVDKVTQEKKDLEQDTAIKKNADDILTKVDKTEQKQKDLEQDKQINQNENDIVKLAIKPTVQGNPLVLKDSADFKAVELEVGGSTSQIQTTGKNLVGKNDISNASGNQWDIVYDFQIGQEYTFSVKKALDIISIRDVSTDEMLKVVYSKNSISFVIQKPAYIRFDSGKYFSTVNELIQIIEPQLEKGSTPTPYEPYTGGKPSPSPEYPQEIVNGVIDRVGCNGKNLVDIFDREKWDRNNEYIFKLPKGTYYLNAKTDGNVYLYPYTYDELTGTWTRINYFLAGNNLVRPISLDLSKETTLKFWINQITELKVIKEFQLEIGSSPTPYEPYKGFTSPIQPIELSKWDKIKKIDGVWKKENCTIDISFNTIEILSDLREFTIADKTTKRYRVNQTIGIIEPVINTSYKGEMLCEKMKTCTGNEMWMNEISQGICVESNGSVSIIDKSIQTLQGMKDFIAKNNLSIVAKSISPTYEILPQETQDVLNKIQTFYPNSTIQTNEGIELNLKYIADTKNYIDNEIAEIKKAIVATGGV